MENIQPAGKTVLAKRKIHVVKKAGKIVKENKNKRVKG